MPGTPLGGRVTGAQLDALETALRRMWSVPAGDLPARRCLPREVIDLVIRDFAVRPEPDGVIGEAMAAAVRFLKGYEPRPARDAVLGHGDPNLANYLWDGELIAIVDFEDAGRSDTAYELASLVEHRSARETDPRRLLERFDVDPADLDEKRCLTAALWLRMLLLAESTGRVQRPVVEEQAVRFLDVRAMSRF